MLSLSCSKNHASASSLSILYCMSIFHFITGVFCVFWCSLTISCSLPQAMTRRKSGSLCLLHKRAQQYSSSFICIPHEIFHICLYHKWMYGHNASHTRFLPPHIITIRFIIPHEIFHYAYAACEYGIWTQANVCVCCADTTPRWCRCVCAIELPYRVPRIPLSRWRIFMFLLAHMHACVHARMHARSQPRAQTHTHTHTHKHARACMHTRASTRTALYTRTNKASLNCHFLTGLVC